MKKYSHKHQKFIPLLIFAVVIMTLACSALVAQSQPTPTAAPSITPIPSTPTQTTTPLPPIATSTPTPARPDPPENLTYKIVCAKDFFGTSTRLAGYDVDIVLSWEEASTNQIGFNIYRNSKLIKTIGKDMTTYSDFAHLSIGKSGSFHYQIAAFNDVGNSSRTSLSVSFSCK